MGMAPLFTTAPRVEIRIGDNAIAYGIGLNLGVSVSLQPIRVIGKFGSIAWEPTMYNVVTGTLQILRLNSTQTMAAQTTAAIAAGASNTFNDGVIVTKDSNGNTIPGTLVQSTDSSTDLTLDSNSPLTQNRLHDHLNPRTVLLSQTFNMTLYMRLPKVSDAEVQKVLLGQDANLNAKAFSDLYETVPWASIVDLRLSSRNTNLALGQLVNEPLSFQGLLMTPISSGEAQFLKDAGVTQVS